MSEEYSNFFKSIDNEINLIGDGTASAEFSGYVDTGCFMLNGLISGSLYGGVPNNKIVSFAGLPASGKTFFVLSVLSSWLKANDENVGLFYDTESSVTMKMFSDRGVDVNRVGFFEPNTVQEFRFRLLKFLEGYEKLKPEKRPKVMVVLDSMGQLSTTKEMEDTLSGAETRDMTKAQILKATWRVLNQKLARCHIPLLVTNHVYSVVGSYVPTQAQSGGTGLLFSASTIVTLGKKKDREGKDVVGNIIVATNYKNRFARENAVAELKLSYTKGLDKYYGLLDIGEKYEVTPKIANRYVMPDGSKHFAKEIYGDPDRFFVPELMQRLEEAVNKEYQYG